MNEIQNIYSLLLRKYGQQGWWPLLDLHGKSGTNPTKTGSVHGYHPGDYSYPENEHQRFEICVGAILTQNTAWPNVEKALLNLKSAGLLNAHDIAKRKIAEHIKPAGYFNQKAEYLKVFARFFLQLHGKIPSRESLLNEKGIGNETADSILLYAYSQPEFVVDVYTKRIFSCIGIIKPSARYTEIKQLFEENLQRDFKVFQEYHALIVEHAKHYYSKMPYGGNDSLLKP